MHRDDQTRATWRKSSYSGNSGNCVEVRIIGRAVAVRDSKNPHGPTAIYTRREWRVLVRHLKAAG